MPFRLRSRESEDPPIGRHLRHAPLNSADSVSRFGGRGDGETENVPGSNSSVLHLPRRDEAFVLPPFRLRRRGVPVPERTFSTNGEADGGIERRAPVAAQDSIEMGQWSGTGEGGGGGKPDIPETPMQGGQPRDALRAQMAASVSPMPADERCRKRLFQDWGEKSPSEADTEVGAPTQCGAVTRAEPLRRWPLVVDLVVPDFQQKQISDAQTVLFTGSVRDSQGQGRRSVDGLEGEDGTEEPFPEERLPGEKAESREGEEEVEKSLAEDEREDAVGEYGLEDAEFGPEGLPVFEDEDDIPLSRLIKPEDEEDIPLSRLIKAEDEDDIPLSRLIKPEDENDIPLSRLIKPKKRASRVLDDSDSDEDKEDARIEQEMRTTSSDRTGKRRRLVKLSDSQANSLPDTDAEDAKDSRPKTPLRRSSRLKGATATTSPLMLRRSVILSDSEEGCETDVNSEDEDEDSFIDDDPQSENSGEEAATDSASDEEKHGSDRSGSSRGSLKGRKKYRWDYEADLLSALAKDIDLCFRGLCALYRRQEGDEQIEVSSKHRNGRGFDKFHASKASTIAKFLLGNGDSSGPVVKTSAAVDAHLGKGAVTFCADMCIRHSKQLFEIYQNQEDRFFPGT